MATTEDISGFGYCETFGLERPPFQDTVNPEFFFQTLPHEEAFQRLLVCCEQGRALGLLTGKSGTGKTLMSQILLQNLDAERFQPVLVLGHPGMTESGVLRHILHELHVPLPAKRLTTEQLLGLVEQAALDAYALGRRIVVLLDEAHFLSSVALHTVRTLTNLETPQAKLVTVIMFGEEFLLRRLRHARHRSLRSRIAIQAHLRPLNDGEVEQFLKYRLLVAGGRSDVIDAAAFETITKHAKGLPREAMRIADIGLLEAHFKGDKHVDGELLSEVLDNGYL